MAHYDTLTDLPNRASFEESLNAALDRAEGAGQQFAILSIDLDRFKEANDTYGHTVGDGLLREIAGRLKAAAGEAFVALFGGDEFAVIGAEGDEYSVTVSPNACSLRRRTTSRSEDTG